jgi:hypothetical protein
MKVRSEGITFLGAQSNFYPYFPRVLSDLGWNAVWMLLHMCEFRQNHLTKCCTFLVGVNVYCVTEYTIGNSGMKEGIFYFKVPAARI